VIVAFPLDDAASFNSRPPLLGSVRSASTSDLPLATLEGAWQHDDTFFLMSDALACWFLEEKAAGNFPWQPLLDLAAADQQDFLNWIAQLRVAKRLRNDDVALVCLKVASE
jgi:hypothetical protein